MNRFYQTILLVVLIMTALGCSKKEPKTIFTSITTVVTYDDKTFGAPKGTVILFDITEDKLESHYLSKAGDFFALSRKDGKNEFAYAIKDLSQNNEEMYSIRSLSSSYVEGEYSHLPKKMLLYIYIEKPTSDHKDMYSFTEVNVGEKDFDFNKSFPAIVSAPLEYGDEYIKW